MPAHDFDYAVVRVVPRVDRDEFINAGVILHCRGADFLGATIALDRARLAALFPAAGRDVDAIERALAVIPRICAGDPAAGPIAGLPRSERFHWLVAPRSTIAQVSAVHSGLCDDPALTLQHLVDTMVKIGEG
ncbi:MAG TPA: DUF3037 domain-containing protein [Kofleriaceae bacterium]|nr:DUF3037 domain-containing protein [Kofleriaceae bacterium]